MLRRNDRDGFLGDVDPESQQPFVDVREMRSNEILVAVRNVEVDVVEAKALDLMIDCACNDVARCKFGALVEPLHEPRSASFDTGRELQLASLATHCFGDQEVLELQTVQAGRMELHEFHVGNPASRPPCHGDPVAGRSPGRGRIK
jgi:hypothetical protein